MITKLCDGTVVDPVEGSYAGDVIIDGERIAAIEPAPTGGCLGEPEDVAAAGLAATADRFIDAAGLLIMPGGIDAHSHADARVFDEDVQLALLRSGVTSIIAGQDGVSFAPGDGRYATEYFGPLNGIHPSYRGGGVGRLLDTWDGATRLNVGYLVPAGTVRYEVLGRRRRQPGDAELAAMVDLVRAGMSQGALGLSSGLDYVPGTFAGEAELAALCAPVAEAGGRYVSHIRGYEEDAPAAFEELINICRRSGAAGHVSHLHARPDLIAGLLERAGECGVDVSWDAYPYDRSFTLLSTALLPPELIMLGNEGAARRLREPAMIDRLTQTIGAGIWRTDQEAGLTGPGSSWAERAYVARAGTQAAASLEGYSLAEAGRRCGIDPIRLGLQLLADSGLTTTAVVRIARPRTDDQLAQQFRLPGACSGSDGIYLGGMPHPRGYGTSARMLSQFGRLRRDFNWPELAAITSGNAALRFGLGDRGRVTAGAIADLALVDPHHVADRADYGGPRRLSTGIAQVFVSGHQVLADGQLTGRLAGCALRGGSR